MRSSVRLCRTCIARSAVLGAAGKGTAGPSRRHASTSSGRSPLKVAVIGSGPSAFYSASRLLQLLPAESDVGKSLEIHMYERLPTPYGLVRYGVAPDHPEVKVRIFLLLLVSLARADCHRTASTSLTSYPPTPASSSLAIPSSPPNPHQHPTSPRLPIQYHITPTRTLSTSRSLLSCHTTPPSSCLTARVFPTRSTYPAETSKASIKPWLWWDGTMVIQHSPIYPSIYVGSRTSR